ncbi:MAG: hypothetical protein GQ570_08205 [Helicobacteraceae bacterium]|nr:hypothetical protein [Helicobacteraceae bacterium]
MGMNIKENEVIFDGVMYEDEVPALRDHLLEVAPTEITFDFTACEDVHLALLQQIMAYKKLCVCNYKFSDKILIYQKVLEGFSLSEDHCN